MNRRIVNGDDLPVDFDCKRNPDLVLSQHARKRLSHRGLACACRAPQKDRAAGVESCAELAQRFVVDHQMREGPIDLLCMNLDRLDALLARLLRVALKSHRRGPRIVVVRQQVHGAVAALRCNGYLVYVPGHAGHQAELLHA